MDTSLINSELIELLSKLTGQPLRKEDLNPPLVFMASLLSVLAGVMFADGQVTDEEKQRWQATLDRLAPKTSQMYQLVQILNKNIHEQKIYNNLYEILGLVSPLSDPERLLLISFGYQMSAADGQIDNKEKKYLEDAAHWMWVNERHQNILEAAFSNQVITDIEALEEVYSWLEPARFQSLDPLFVNAAGHILEQLPSRPQQKPHRQREKISYEDLKSFQEYRKKLNGICYQLFQIIQDCVERKFVFQSLINEITQISQKIQSPTFRIAVVGEFSKGKSTLLNALLGENIQPVRALPCSGVITILRHGLEKRVICRYKDGREEELSPEEYQIKASIPKEAARDYYRDELAQCDIDEIIFEHPNLEFCRYGIEILDSPGLNEHPDRTAITQKLLKEIDLAIFMSNAQNTPTEAERFIIQDLKIQLNGGNPEKPANNLFMVVNFMDLLETEEDREDVPLRVINFLQGKQPIIEGENRIHFISARKVLKAQSENVEDEYLESFENFILALEKFLVFERGILEKKQFTHKINTVIQSTLEGLSQAEKVLSGQIEFSEQEKQQVLEKIGEASGCDYRIRILGEEVKDEAFEETNDSWNSWIEKLPERLAEKAEKWTSSHNAIFQQKEVTQDYVNQFLRDLQQEIDQWGNQELSTKILKPKLEALDLEIHKQLRKIQKSFSHLDRQINTNFGKQINVAMNQIEGTLGDIWDYLWGGIGGGGFGVALLAFIGIGGPILLAAAGIGAAIAGALGSGTGGMYQKLKVKVFEAGRDKFRNNTTQKQLTNKICETIDSVFDTRIEAASDVIEKAIFLCENLLEQQEEIHQNALKQSEKDIPLILQKRQELNQICQEIEAISNESA